MNSAHGNRPISRANAEGRKQEESSREKLSFEMNPVLVHACCFFFKSVIIQWTNQRSPRLFITPLIARFSFLSLSLFFDSCSTLELTTLSLPHLPGIFVTL